ncbi:hypothetical protein [Microbulbifer sp. TYP-18]|uniref:hypothetical protein n=1 Tax=Microbulbifer sp. TYP-18 TaxID=3230024 RepID=UPI0034C5CF49
MNEIPDTTTNNPEAVTEQRSWFGRMQGVSVIASVVLPIAAAYLVYHTGVGMPQGTINEGDLLHPAVDLSLLPMREQGTEPVQLAGEPVKWRYLIFSDRNCGSDCEKLLYTSRQVHIRLGEKADRLERMLITSTSLPADQQQTLSEQHPRLRFLVVPSEEFARLQSDTGVLNRNQPEALLVDQAGFAMMAYDNHHTGNQLLKDIKRLLKYSYEQ